MADYTPTIEDVRNHYAYGCGPDHTWDGSRADFDAWLAEHDAKVRAEEREKADRERAVCDHGCTAVTGLCIVDHKPTTASEQADREPSDAERLSQDELAAISWCISYVATKGGFFQLARRDAPPVKFADLNSKIGKMYEQQEARRG